MSQRSVSGTEVVSPAQPSAPEIPASDGAGDPSVERQKIALERDRLELDRQRFASERERATRADRKLVQDPAVIITSILSLVGLIATGAFGYFQNQLANVQKDRELALAERQKEHDQLVAWQHDFSQYMKDNDAVIFGDDPKARLIKRQTILATFPPEVVGQLVHTLRSDTLSVEEQALLDDSAPEPAENADAGVAAAPAHVSPATGAAPAVASPATAATAGKAAVYIQYASAGDLGEVDDIRDALGATYNVRGIEVAEKVTVPVPEVRHFSRDDDDKNTAVAIRDILNQYFSSHHQNVKARTATLAGRYRNLARNTFQIVLPVLNASDPKTAERHEKRDGG
jgi:hypothetical protein